MNPWILAPMDSIPILNTIDALSPTSAVLPLPDTTPYWEFEVHWSGVDDSLGSGLRDYTIYVSDNGASYSPWIVDTMDTMATFEGEYGHTYSFYSIASDNVGYHEVPPDTPDAVITVVNSPPEAFSLLSPPDGAQVSSDTIIFYWEESYDPDSVLYCLYLSPDSTFTDTLTTIIVDSLVDSTYTLIPFDSSKSCEAHSHRSAMNEEERVSARIDKKIMNGVRKFSLLDGKLHRGGRRQHRVKGKDRAGAAKKAKPNIEVKTPPGMVKERIAQTVSDNGAIAKSGIELIPDTTYYWKVKAYDRYGVYRWSNQVWSFHSTPVGIQSADKGLGLPQTFSLSQNYPNPFNPLTVIKYALPKACDVKLIIYNILGQRVITLVNEPQVAGYKTVRWDSRSQSGNEVASGIYFYRLEAEDFVETKKMVLIR